MSDKIKFITISLLIIVGSFIIVGYNPITMNHIEENFNNQQAMTTDEFIESDSFNYRIAISNAEDLYTTKELEDIKNDRELFYRNSRIYYTTLLWVGFVIAVAFLGTIIFLLEKKDDEESME